MQLFLSYLAGQCNVHDVKIELLLVQSFVQSFNDKSISMLVFSSTV